MVKKIFYEHYYLVSIWLDYFFMNYKKKKKTISTVFQFGVT